MCNYKKVIYIFIILIAILLLPMSIEAMTSSVSLDKISYESNERILGDTAIILNEGDLIPANTSISITTNMQTVTLSLLEFMTLSSNPNFNYTNGTFTNVDGSNTFEGQSGFDGPGQRQPRHTHHRARRTGRDRAPGRGGPLPCLVPGQLGAAGHLLRSFHLHPHR